MDYAVRHLQIYPCVVVNGAVEVHRIVGERIAKPMVVEEHRRDAVETVSVESVLLQPELAVGEEEVQDLGLSVVEAPAAPRRMPPLAAGMEVLPVSAVELRQPVALVGDGMGVYKVHYDAQPHSVRSIDQRLEVVRRAEARRRGEEGAYVVAEAAVVGMLHYGHQLHRVVAGLLYARQHIVAELRVSPDALFLRGHSDVRLVYARDA